MRLESSRGRGTVVSETTIVMAPSAALAEWAPYQVILVELEEGFTLMSNIVGETRAAIVTWCRSHSSSRARDVPSRSSKSFSRTIGR